MKKTIILFVCTFFISFLSVSGREITISSATSLKSVVEKLILEYNKKNEQLKINVNYGSSGTLRKQIENGAEIDVVLFADKENLQKLEKQGLIENRERKFKVLNSLIFVGNKPLDKKGVLGLCEAKVVPLGNYSMEALSNKKYKKIYEDLRGNTVIVRDFREVLNGLENENIDYGILYKTEIKHLIKSYVLFEIDSDTHSEIEYSFGVVKQEKSKNKDNIEVEKIYEFLNSEQSEKIFQEFGFKIEKI